MKIIELFAGIGACSVALKRIGIDLEIVDAVEIDKYAIKSFNAIHNTNFETQDITAYNKNFNDIDLITHGSPCQDFSVAGKQAGGDLGSGTRSSLLYETIRIVGQIRPKYILWENVKNVLSKKHKHNFDNYINTLNTLGYNSYYQVLNAKDYGIPQNRERVYAISIRKDIDKGTFEFPEKEELKLRLKDMLEDEVDRKYYLSKKMKDYVLSTGTKNFYKKTEINPEIAKTLLASMTKMHRAGIDNYVTDKCIQIGELDMKGLDCVKRVYSSKGISPTLTNMQGGNRQPKIEVVGQASSEGSQAGTIYSDKGISPNLCARTHGYAMGNIETNAKIRKLTPKECWRLMGFKDVEFEKAKNIPTSDTQLYKQAGNSIVVNVLEKIFLNLFKKE